MTTSDWAAISMKSHKPVLILLLCAVLLTVGIFLKCQKKNDAYGMATGNFIERWSRIPLCFGVCWLPLSLIVAPLFDLQGLFVVIAPIYFIIAATVSANTLMWASCSNRGKVEKQESKNNIYKSWNDGYISGYKEGQKRGIFLSTRFNEIGENNKYLLPMLNDTPGYIEYGRQDRVCSVFGRIYLIPTEASYAIGTLPTGFAPNFKIIKTLHGKLENAPINIEITPDGYITAVSTIHSALKTDFYSLCIQFSVE